MKIDDVFKSAAKGCQDPTCTVKHGELVLTAVCHPQAGMRVSIDADKGKMEIACGTCNQPVLIINHTMSN